MIHDIIDNHEHRLVDIVRDFLNRSSSFRFATGYLYLPGIESLIEGMGQTHRSRLLIGTPVAREGGESVIESRHRIEFASAQEESEFFLKRSEQRRRAKGLASHLGEAIDLMDQTETHQRMLERLLVLILENRLQVRVLTRGRLQGRAYIFDFPASDDPDRGIGIVGSSNLTLGDLPGRTDLNVIVRGNENHERLTRWFDELWAEAQDFSGLLAEELRQSWVLATASPYDVYMKTLFELVRDRIEDGESAAPLWDDELTQSLADFQKTAVRQAIQIIRDHGGVFLSDVVGLGKSYIGAAVLKHFVRTSGARPLIICPKSLEDMWRGYNDDFVLGAKILPMSLLRVPADGRMVPVLEQPAFADRDFVLVDESHNFRNHTSQRYETLQSFLARGRKNVCFLTATPQNRHTKDVFNQLALFHPFGITNLPIDPPDLKEFEKLVENRQRRLQDLLVHILIRRTRRHVLRWYGFAEGSQQKLSDLSDEEARPFLSGEKRAYVLVGNRPQYFPKRQLETLRYSIEKTYSGFYDKIRRCLGQPNTHGPRSGSARQMSYARYGLWNYVVPELQEVEPYRNLRRAGINLRGLIKVLLLKRLESSVHAFRTTLERMEKTHAMFLAALDQGIVPAGEDAQKLLGQVDSLEDGDWLNTLAASADTYDIDDFDQHLLRHHLAADHQLIQELIDTVAPISAARDAKLQIFMKQLKEVFPKTSKKVLVFSQFADTVKYLFDNINPAGNFEDIAVVYGSAVNKARIAACFSPRSNPSGSFGEAGEIRILLATDVFSEGLNLQDCDVVVNYDLHWNPVRLIQRMGRIDRIGTETERIWAYNFLPELELEKDLGLHQILRYRIKEIHETIGEDAAILDPDEQLNEEAFYAIYENQYGKLSTHEDPDGDYLGIAEIEELIRNLRATEPEEFTRIASLRDGIRSARAARSHEARVVFCQAGRFQKLFLTDANGEIVTSDTAAILAAIRCKPDEPAGQIPGGFNQALMKTLAVFKEQADHRRTLQQHSLSLTQAQRYVLRKLRAYFSSLDASESDTRSQIATLEQAFRRPVTAAVRRQLNTLRKHGVEGAPLFQTLSELYFDHGLNELAAEFDRRQAEPADEWPRIICSEALI